MSAVAEPAPRPAPASLPQFRDLARRAIASTLHGGDALALPILFPLIILAINVKALQSILAIAAFPAGNVTEFVIALTFLQGALFSGIACGSRMASDIESGFIKRIALAPVSMLTVVNARFASVALVGLVQVACYLVAALAGGAHIAAGVGGAFALAALMLLFDMAFAALAILLAVLTRSGEAIQSLFPVFFVFVMLSSALMPRNLIEVSWFRDVAQANPATYMLEAVRSLFLKGWSPQPLELGVGMAVGILLLASLLSLLVMRRLVVKP